MHENGPSLQRTYNPEGETDVFTRDNPVVTVIADDARKAPIEGGPGTGCHNTCSMAQELFQEVHSRAGLKG